MLLSKRCPHTGLINFYARGEPFIAVGSVLEISGPRRFQWRCYVGREAATGSASDFFTAERDLLRRYHEVARAEMDCAAADSRRARGRASVAVVR